jgi:hypothetical protein
MLVANDGFALRWWRAERSDRSRHIRRRQWLQYLCLNDETLRRNLARRRVHRAFATSRNHLATAALAVCLSGFNPTCRMEATNGTQKLRFK